MHDGAASPSSRSICVDSLFDSSRREEGWTCSSKIDGAWKDDDDKGAMESNEVRGRSDLELWHRDLYFFLRRARSSNGVYEGVATKVSSEEVDEEMVSGVDCGVKDEAYDGDE